MVLYMHCTMKTLAHVIQHIVRCRYALLPTRIHSYRCIKTCCKSGFAPLQTGLWLMGIKCWVYARDEVAQKSSNCAASSKQSRFSAPRNKLTWEFPTHKIFKQLTRWIIRQGTCILHARKYSNRGKMNTYTPLQSSSSAPAVYPVLEGRFQSSLAGFCLSSNQA